MVFLNPTKQINGISRSGHWLIGHKVSKMDIRDLHPLWCALDYQRSFLAWINSCLCLFSATIVRSNAFHFCQVSFYFFRHCRWLRLGLNISISDMQWADILTKTLQPKPFQELHNKLVVCPQVWRGMLKLMTDKRLVSVITLFVILSLSL